MVFTDAKEPNHPLIFANDSFLSLAGYDREEVLAQSFDFLMARPLDHEAWTQVEAAFAGSSEGDLDICFRRTDGGGVLVCRICKPGSGRRTRRR